MGYYLMPVRGEHDDLVDDFVVWSTFSDAPVARGTREQVTTWWRSMFGEAGVASLDAQSAFIRADIHGSSSSMNGRWGSTIRIHGWGLLGPAELDRGKLPAFVAQVVPFHCHNDSPDTRDLAAIGRAVRALVIPFDPAEDPEIDPEVWKLQAEQAIADFEGRHGG